MSERFVGPSWGVLATGASYCTTSRVALDCRVVDVREVGTHSVMFAEVLSTAHAGDSEPLIYHSRTQLSGTSLEPIDHPPSKRS